MGFTVHMTASVYRETIIFLNVLGNRRIRLIFLQMYGTEKCEDNKTSMMSILKPYKRPNSKVVDSQDIYVFVLELQTQKARCSPMYRLRVKLRAHFWN